MPDEPPDQPEDQNTRLTAWVHGHVQGVGFRWWTRRQAIRLGLTGYASNLADGRVKIVVEGSRTGCVRLLDELRSEQTPAWVGTVVERWSPARGDLTGFVVR